MNTIPHNKFMSASDKALLKQIETRKAEIRGAKKQRIQRINVILFIAAKALFIASLATLISYTV
jgi:hypothetical protein